MALATAVPAVNATIYTRTIDAATYGTAGTITLDDWGYTGPNGRTADDFSAVNGFGGLAEGNTLDATGGIGQIQNVITQEHDWATPDAYQTVNKDFNQAVYTNANMDSGVNFYSWAYTSPGGSTFNNMQIDYDGDYLVNKDDMNFNFYNYFDYRNEATADPNDPNDFQRIQTNLAFQPYALSDATGWCGSAMASHPNALEGMAGQLTFDFAFDVYNQQADGTLYYMSTEIVSGFQMRSFGDITVDVTNALGDSQQFTSRAVVNNTNPTTGNTVADASAPVDPDYHNLVSFHGADVVSGLGSCGIETAEWAAGNKGPGIKRYSTTIDAADAGACSSAGGVWQGHAFTGYAFILRADGMRVIEYFDESVYGPDPFAVSAVPVPAAVWLFASGLVGLVGVSRKRKS